MTGDRVSQSELNAEQNTSPPSELQDAGRGVLATAGLVTGGVLVSVLAYVALRIMARGLLALVAFALMGVLIGWMWSRFRPWATAVGAAGVAVVCERVLGAPSSWLIASAGATPVPHRLVAVGQFAAAALAAGLAALVVTGFVRRLAPADKRVGWIVTFVLAGFLVLAMVTFPGDIITKRPAPVGAEYVTSSDATLYLRVYHDVSHGQEYYSSFAHALAFDVSMRSKPKSPLSFRLPTLTYLWALVAREQPDRIRALYVILCVIAVASAYALASRLASPKFGIAAALLMLPYAYTIGTTRMFLFTEIWSGLIGVCALAAYAYRDKLKGGVLASALLALLAFLVREHLIMILAGGFLASALERRWRDVAIWGACAVAGASVYVAHVLATRPYVTQGTAGVAKYLAGGLSFEHLHATMIWAAGAVTGREFVQPTVVLFAAVGVVFLTNWPDRLFYGLPSVGIPLAILLVNDSTGVSGQWGMTFMPAAMCLAPVGASALAQLVARLGRRTRRSDQPRSRANMA